MALSTRSIGKKTAVPEKKPLLTQRPTTEERKLIVEEMRNQHALAFEMLGITNPYFYPKAAFKWKDGLYVSLYEKELTAENFFTELTDNFYNPLDPEKRSLYRLKGNPDYLNEYYRKSEETYDRWFVPIEELEEINLTSLALKSTSTSDHTILDEKPPFEMDEEDSPEPKDAPMSKMTMKDHCAIEWRLPVSDKQWLNDLIRKTNIESAKKSK